jgi:hypothetical protein
MLAYIAFAQLVLYAAGAALLYRVTCRLVEQHRVSAFTASALYWVALAATPSVITLAVGRVGNYVFSSGFVTSEAAWDVGLAIWLLIGTWACYISGFFVASLASWRFTQISRGSAGVRAT